MDSMAAGAKQRQFSFLGKKSKDRSKNITFALFVTPGLILYSIFLVLPVVMGVYYSVTDWNGISRRFNIVGIKNYRSILETVDSPTLCCSISNIRCFSPCVLLC